VPEILLRVHEHLPKSHFMPLYVILLVQLETEKDYMPEIWLRTSMARSTFDMTVVMDAEVSIVEIILSNTIRYDIAMS
jgi:hypothetical protein